MRKLITNRSTWSKLLTGLFLLTMTWSCALQEAEISEAEPTLQEGLTPPGKGGTVGNCYCPNNCEQFDAAHSIMPFIPTNIPFSGSYDIAVNVVAQNSCDLSQLQGQNCALKRTDLILGFAQGLSIHYFEHFALFNDQGNPIPFNTTTYPGSIAASGAFTACFKLKAAYSDFAFQNTHFTSGGICIIGIVTDPDGSGGTGGVDPGDDNG